MLSGVEIFQVLVSDHLKGGLIFFRIIIINSVTFKLFFIAKVILNCKVISIICLDIVSYFIQTSAPL